MKYIFKNSHQSIQNQHKKNNFRSANIIYVDADANPFFIVNHICYEITIDRALDMLGLLVEYREQNIYKNIMFSIDGMFVDMNKDDRDMLYTNIIQYLQRQVVNIEFVYHELNSYIKYKTEHIKITECLVHNLTDQIDKYLESGIDYPAYISINNHSLLLSHDCINDLDNYLSCCLGDLLCEDFPHAFETIM